MRILLVKLSSLGDVIHALPAVSDAAASIPDLAIDWVVEEAFAEIPAWHPAVRTVIPVAIRRWRKTLHARETRAEIGAFLRTLRTERYDRVIDAQGLIKSSTLALAARGPRGGFDRRSIREPLASNYGRRHAVSKDLHAVERIRRLFAADLGYPSPDTPPDYGVAPMWSPGGRDILLLHGATWANKRWPDAHWAGLARLAADAGYRVRVPALGEKERAWAQTLVKNAGTGELLPPGSLADMAGHLRAAAGAVGVDTGLAHLAAALGTPSVTLFGPTDPAFNGAAGPRQTNLAADFACAPCGWRVCTYKGSSEVVPACFATLPPATAWEALKARMETAAG